MINRTAYGQTGSGKTFTITGGAERYADRGIIPRTLTYIFEYIEKQSSDYAFTVHVSYLEIYNESGSDLLDPKHEAAKLEDLPKVNLMEDSDQNIHLKNLTVHQTNNEEEALNLLFLGDTNRTIAEAIQVQKRKVEDEKSKQTEVIREAKTMSVTCQDLETKRQKLASELQIKENLISCLNGQLSSTKQKLEIESQKKSNQSDLESRDKKISTLESEIKSLKNDAATLKQANSDYKSKLLERDVELDNVKTEYGKSSGKLQNIDAEFKRQTKDLQSQKYFAEDKVNRNKQELDSLNQKLKESYRQLELLNCQLTEKNKDVEKSSATIKDLRRANDEMNVCLSQQKEKTTLLQKEMSDKDSTLKELNGAIERYEKEVSTLKLRCGELSGTLENKSQVLCIWMVEWSLLIRYSD